MSRFMMSVVLIVTLFGMTGAVVDAQETPTIYTVTAPQTVNARGCPRLSCPVLQTFAPGDQLTVIEVVPGESVLDSDEWLHMNVDGVDLYVHSSLAAPLVSPSDAPPPASGRDASEDSAPAGSSSGDSASGATSGWRTHTGVGFTLDTPPSWMDFTELLADEDYLASVTEFLGEDSGATVEALKTMCGEGACDAVMVDLHGRMALFMMHVDTEGISFSAQMWKILLEQQFEDSGADVISSEIVDLPAGEAVRFHLVLAIGMAQMDIDYIVYMVITSDRMYMLMFYVDSCCVEEYGAVVDQIAESFRVETATTVE
jgi:hypothetical protein